MQSSKISPKNVTIDANDFIYPTYIQFSNAGSGPNIWQISQPYSSRGGQILIIPTFYYWHPQCFSPSGITVVSIGRARPW